MSGVMQDWIQYIN